MASRLILGAKYGTIRHPRVPRKLTQRDSISTNSGCTGRRQMDRTQLADMNCVAYMVDRHVHAGRADEVALVELKAGERRSLTYRELGRCVQAGSVYISERFRQNGQMRIAVAGSCTLETVVAWLAIMRTGHIACLVPPRQQEQYYSSLWAKLKPAEIWSDWTASDSVGARPIPQWEQGTADCGAGIISGEGDQPALMLVTSGSTGSPKVCVHSHRAFLEFDTHVSMGAWCLQQGDRVIGSSRPHFSFGLQAIHAALMVGATAVMLPHSAQHTDYLDAITAEQATVFLGVPTLFNMLLGRRKSHHDVTSLRLTLTAGEKIPSAVRAAWQDWTQGAMLDSIGTTETFLPYLSERAQDPQSGLCSVNSFEYRFSQYEEDARSDLFVPEITSKAMMLGYLGEDGAIQPKKKWFRTDDVFRKTGDQSWEFTSRSSEMVKIGATWVAPQTLEEHLLQVPGVAQAAAVSVITAEGFTRLRAFVVLDRNTSAGENWKSEGVDRYLRSVLPTWTLRPDRVEVVQSLPVTPSGKLLRRELYRLLDTADCEASAPQPLTLERDGRHLNGTVELPMLE